jgi:hypothetical protein
MDVRRRQLCTKGQMPYGFELILKKADSHAETATNYSFLLLFHVGGSSDDF